MATILYKCINLFFAMYSLSSIIINVNIIFCAIQLKSFGHVKILVFQDLHILSQKKMGAIAW